MLWEEPCITICCFSVPGSKSKCFWPNKTKNIIPIQHSCSLRGIAFPSQLSNPCFPMHFLPEQNQPNQNRRIVSIKQNSFLPSFCISINLPYLKKTQQLMISSEFMIDFCLRSLFMWSLRSLILNSPRPAFWIAVTFLEISRIT